MDGAPELDWTPYAAAGLLDVDDAASPARKQLLAFLTEQGFTIDEMVRAHARGRLFGLAGDYVLRPGAFGLTLTEVAQRVGADESFVRRLWQALGLIGANSDERVASEEDVGAFRTVMAAAPFLGEQMTIDMARSVGAGLARIADAVQSLGRTLSPAGSVATSGDEFATAQYWSMAAPLVANLGSIMDVFFRHHYEVARWHFERSDSVDLMLSGRARLAVAFVDMSGFTSTSEQLNDTEFERLVTSFMDDVSDTVQHHGGRVVKFIGDAAMIVAPSVADLAEITAALVAREDRSTRVAFHAGLAYGDVLTRDGDCFGNAVNLAARLAALAGPGSVLASAEAGRRMEANGWQVEYLDPQPIRGFAQPIAICRVLLT